VATFEELFSKSSLAYAKCINFMPSHQFQSAGGFVVNIFDPDSALVSDYERFARSFTQFIVIRRRPSLNLPSGKASW
jgi:hypothetical protein